jgi:hypothetical protein
MIIDRQEQRLFARGRPPLVDGGIVLPEFAQARAFPSAAGFGARFWPADEIGKMCADKSGDGFAMAFEAKADGQFIGGQLEVGRFLQRNEIPEELTSLRGPIGTVVATRKPGAQVRAVLYPAGAESVKVRQADVEMAAGFDGVDLPVVELLEDMLEKWFW